MPNLSLKGAENSPVLMIAGAGAALVGAVWIFSHNRPASEVVGGQLPFSWDALANWLAGRNGGIGTDPGLLPKPLPLALPRPSFDPYGPNLPWAPPPSTDPRDPPAPGFGSGDPVPDPRDPPPGGTAFGDEGGAENATIPILAEGGGGQARILGLDNDNLYSARYNLLYALQSTDRPEEGTFGGGH